MSIDTPGHDQAPRSEREKRELFQDLQKYGPVSKHRIAELFEVFGEPGDQNIKLASNGSLIFTYRSYGDIPVMPKALIRLSKREKGPDPDLVELKDPWICQPTGKWEGPVNRWVMASFSLDKVRNSNFNRVIIEGVHDNFPPRIDHEVFDLLDSKVQQEIADKIKPTMLTPEQSAQREWQHVVENSPVGKLRTLMINLQRSGEVKWKQDKLYIGPDAIDLSVIYRPEPKDLKTDPKNAVEDFLKHARRLYNVYVNPEKSRSFPETDEPLFGIPSAAQWREAYVDAFNKLYAQAGWEAQDAKALQRHAEALKRKPREVTLNVVGFVDLTRKPKPDNQSQAAQPEIAATSQSASGAEEVELPQAEKQELKQLEITDGKYFKDEQGHMNKLTKSELRDLRDGKRVELHCSNCNNEVVGFAQLEQSK